MGLFIANCQLFSAFGASGAKDFSAAFGFHAGQKAMHFQMFAFLEFGDRHCYWGDLCQQKITFSLFCVNFIFMLNFWLLQHL